MISFLQLITRSTYSRLVYEIDVISRNVENDDAVGGPLVHLHLVQVLTERGFVEVTQHVDLHLNHGGTLWDSLVCCGNSQL